MSSSSSAGSAARSTGAVPGSAISLTATAPSLHLVEDFGEGGFDRQRLLDLVGAHIGIFPVFEETRTVMGADELHEGVRIGLPVLREAHQVLENGVDARLLEQFDGVLGILVEVGVEDALVHE